MEHTVRQQIISLLVEREMTARELSQTLGVSEREITSHLPHLDRSLRSRGGRLVIHPSRCLTCGYVFDHRSRVTRPGRCPRCKQSHIESPTYRVV